MPDRRFLGNFSDLSELHFFLKIFSKLLYVLHIGLVPRKSMSPLFESMMRVFAAFARRTFLVRVVFTVVIIPGHTLAYRTL